MNQKKRIVIMEANSAKSKLLEVVRKLEALPRTKTSSEQLRALIARIADWQNRHI